MNLFPAEVKEEKGKTVLVSGGVTLSLSPEKAGAAGKTGEARMLVGIRPEHLSVHNADGTGALDGEVKVLEPLGREDLLHVQTPVGNILALTSEKRFKPEQRVRLSFDEEELHCFPMS